MRVEPAAIAFSGTSLRLRCDDAKHPHDEGTEVTEPTDFLAPGDRFPDLDLVDPRGEETTWSAVRAAGPTMAYFMRSSRCYQGGEHLRQLASSAINFVSTVPLTVVIVPGGAKEAASVERRHPQLAGRVFASATAHAQVGLPLTEDPQRSGNAVVAPDGVVTYSRSSDNPWTAIYHPETRAALGG